MTPADVAVVPSTPALLPEYAGLVDPVAELRASCRRAVAWLVGRHPHRITVLAAVSRPDNVERGVVTGVGIRLATHLLREAGFTGDVTEETLEDHGGVLVVANGSAKRGEKAPGHLDPRSPGFDQGLGRCLADGDAPALRELDEALGAELWAYDVPVLRVLGGLVAPPVEVVVDFDADPFGVQYWVVRWSCGS